MKYVSIEDGTEKCIKAIGQSLINKAKDISRNIDLVTSIIIHAEINSDEIVNFNVTKNYIATLNDEKNNCEKNICQKLNNLGDDDCE